MVGYRADDLRDRRYHHRHPFIRGDCAMQCAEDCTLITIQSHEILAKQPQIEQTTSELVVQESIGDAILRMRR